MKHLYILLVAIMATFAYSPAYAFVKVPTADVISVSELTPSASITSTVTTEKSRKELRKERRQERWKKKISNFMDRMSDIDFSDPVKKWLWFWLLAWAAALILTIISVILAAGSVTTGSAGGLGIAGILSILAWLLWLAGTVFAIIWLIKMFA